jgi:ADP-ribose pyrophosphatase
LPKVEFEDISAVEDSLLKYAVIVSQHHGKWIYCKHKERNTWEIPGGRREPEESILNTSKRELFEESGALDYELTPVCAYCVAGDTRSYGLLCYAHINLLGQLPVSEIDHIQLFDDEPETLTYPHIQPFLFAKVKSWLVEN